MNQYFFYFLFIVFHITTIFTGCSPIHYFKRHPSEIRIKVIKIYKKDSDTNTEWLSREYSVLINENETIIRDRHNDTILHGVYVSYRKDSSKSSVREYRFGKLKKLTNYLNDGTKKIQLIHHEKDNDTTIYYNWQNDFVEKIKRRTNNFNDTTVGIQINRHGKEIDTTIFYNRQGEFDTTTKSTIEKITIRKNRYNYYDIHFNPDGSIKEFPKVGLLPYPIIAVYWGYPSVVSARFGINLALPSQNRHLRVFPYYLFMFAEPGVSCAKGGLGISKKIDTRYLKKTAFQFVAHYSWYEVDWNKFPHIPVKNGFIGGDVEITFGVFGLFSVKAGPHFKVYGNSENNFLFSVEFGFDILEFKNTILIGAG